MEGKSRLGWPPLLFSLLVVLAAAPASAEEEKAGRRHAYASMMYMGTPRDYEFYVATRVMMRSLASLGVGADLVVIASADVPTHWVQTMEEQDGLKVVKVENLKNPYENQGDFNKRFKLTLNKLYAWSLVSYDRVVMIDSDNIFLQRTDELFQCGQFCAVFINPCIFHTGLFVLQPSMDVYKDMLHELEIGRKNTDGADQGFLTSYFPDLLDKPMFHPPANGTKLTGTYRLPLGYQMDASYYYLRLRWSVPCGPNSVITFPGAPWLKPWYWWSWPVLPLGLSWHEQRRKNLGYHHCDPAGEADIVEAVLQPTSGEEPGLVTCYVEVVGNNVHTCGLHPSLLHHPAYRASIARLVPVYARDCSSLFDHNQRLPTSASLCSCGVDGDIWYIVCDGISLVQKWNYQGISSVCLCILLCSCCLGIYEECDELPAEFTCKGNFL